MDNLETFDTGFDQNLKKIFDLMLEVELARSKLTVISVAPKKSYKTLGLFATSAVVSLLAIKYRRRIAKTLVNLQVGTSNFIRNCLGVNIYSILVDLCTSEVLVDNRDEFFSFPAIKIRPMSNHSHPYAAGVRSSANQFMLNYLRSLGKEHFDLSKSKTRVVGNHWYYNAKDLQQECGTFGDPEGKVLTMTDVDYYVDMPHLLQGQDVLFYTFDPAEPGGTAENFYYHTNEDNTITMKVNGGGEYTHELWNYHYDHLIIDHWWGSVMYLVDSRQITDQHKVILLSCKRKIYGPLGWILPGNRLERRRLVWGDVAYVRRALKEETVKVTHAFASIRATASAIVDDATIQTVLIRLQTSKTPAISDVERIMRAHDVKAPDFAASVLFQMCAERTELLKEVMVHARTYGRTIDNISTSYQTLAPLVTEDGHEPMRRITAPILNASAVPLRSHNNDTSCVKHRLNDVKNNVYAYAPFYFQALDEFVKLLIPDQLVHTIVPGDFKSQYDQFNRPSQRGFLNAIKHVMFYDTIWSVRSFQKAESYSKYTAPRNISTLPMDHNARLGQFSRELCDHIMKPAHWYAFGRHPTDVTAMIMDKANLANNVVSTDISKCDGSTGLIHYYLIRAIVMRAFPICYHKEILQLLHKESGAQGTTATGLKYDASFTTLSGSSNTSWRNSVINAYNNYAALRKSIDDPEQAYNALGVYAGDDGMTFNVDPNIVMKTFGKLGMLVKAEVLKRGSPVPFLGRIYIDPWTTDESIIDVKRHAIKFHLTASPPDVPKHVVLRRKAEGYRITDPTTPIISEWCQWVENNFPAITERERKRFERYLNVDVTFWSKYESPFPPLKNHQLIRVIICDNMQMSPESLDQLATQLLTDDADLKLSAYKPTTPIPVQLDVAAGGVILNAPKQPVHQQQVKDNAALKTKQTSKPVPLQTQTKTKRLGVNQLNRSQKPLAQQARVKKSNSRPNFRETWPLKEGDAVSKEVPVCKQFAAGKCSFGQRCKFIHQVKVTQI